MSAVPCPMASRIWMGRKTVHWRIVSSASRRGTCLIDILGRKKKLDVDEPCVSRESLARGFQCLMQGLEFGDRGRIETYVGVVMPGHTAGEDSQGRSKDLGAGEQVGIFQAEGTVWLSLRIKKEGSSEIVTFLLVSAFTEHEKNDTFGLR